MTQIRLDDAIPEEHVPFLRSYFNLAFAAGFDEGRNDVYRRYSKKKSPVLQFDLSGKRVGAYESVAQASRECKIHKSCIFEAIQTGKPSKGYYWTKKEPYEHPDQKEVLLERDDQ